VRPGKARDNYNVKAGRALNAVVLFSVAGLSIALAGQAETPVDPESYAVYRTLIPFHGLGKGRIVVRRETFADRRCFPKGRPLAEEWKPVVHDFVEQNSRPRTLQPGFDIGRDYMLVPSKDIEAEFIGAPTGDWSTFYARYPNSGGFIELSAVGFDSTKTRAIVYGAHHCGGLCGKGAYHLMEKTGGQWREANINDVEFCLWIS
jgi:hypothetical protein